MKGLKIKYRYDRDDECEGTVLDKIIQSEDIHERISHDRGRTKERIVTKYIVLQSKPYEMINIILPNAIIAVI